MQNINVCILQGSRGLRRRGAALRQEQPCRAILTCGPQPMSKCTVSRGVLARCCRAYDRQASSQGRKQGSNRSSAEVFRLVGNNKLPHLPCIVFFLLSAVMFLSPRPGDSILTFPSFRYLCCVFKLEFWTYAKETSR